MARVGHVVEKKGEFVVVSTARRGVCEGCSEQSTCSFDPALGGGKPEDVTVRDPIGTCLGDMVEFDLTGHTELKVSLIVWILPLIGVLVGAVLGLKNHTAMSVSSDFGTLVGAVAGFVVTFGAIMFYEKYMANKTALLPVILKKVSPTACDTHPAE